MSQSEILTILSKFKRIAGGITIDELAHEYNLLHFPTNHNYCNVSKVVVKKTMAHDIARLLRDRIITRTRIYRPHNKPLIKYELTEFGKYRLSTIQPLYNLQTTT